MAGAHTIVLVVYAIIAGVSILSVWDLERDERKTRILIESGRERRERSKYRYTITQNVTDSRNALNAPPIGLTDSNKSATLGHD